MVKKKGGSDKFSNVVNDMNDNLGPSKVPKSPTLPVVVTSCMYVWGRRECRKVVKVVFFWSGDNRIQEI